VLLRDLVDREAEGVGLSVVRASTHRDHEAWTASCSDDHVPGVRRAMHEVPRAQLPLLAFDDQNRFARNDEEVLLVGLPVVHRHRFARLEHERIDPELFELAPALEVVGDNADGAAAVGVTPLGVAHVEDEPSLDLRDEPVLGLLRFRLGNHELEACRSRCVLRKRSTGFAAVDHLCGSSYRRAVAPFVDGATDPAAAARIATEVLRWWTVTTESIAHNRAHLPTYRDWLAMIDGDPVGVAFCAEFPGVETSGAAWAGVAVVKSARRRGLGTALYELVSDHARSIDKTEIEVLAYEDDPDGVGYAKRRGFACVERIRALRLLLAGCPMPSVDAPEEVTLTTLAEQPELARGVWEVAYEAMPDIPTDSDAPLHPGTFEEFQALVLSGPRYIAEATFVAVHGGEAIGYGQLTWNDATRGIGYHNMLAVRRRFRGRGIASLLKAAQIGWAITNGLTELRTGNEVRNAPIRAVNARYSYEPIPDALILRGPLAAK
jgi:GNAT superfamily N-acetyltransferase